jgi:lipopolysaccharide export system protein LptA
MRKAYLLLAISSLLLSAQKLEITADEFVAEDAQKQVNFIGNAHIKQGEATVSAGKIVLYFNEDNSTKMYEAVEAVSFHIKRSKSNYTGSCQSMQYLPNTQQYILRGNVKIKDKSNKRDILANRIDINIKTGAFTIKGNKKHAAKLTFEMK